MTADHKLTNHLYRSPNLTLFPYCNHHTALQGKKKADGFSSHQQLNMFSCLRWGQANILLTQRCDRRCDCGMWETGFGELCGLWQTAAVLMWETGLDWLCGLWQTAAVLMPSCTQRWVRMKSDIQLLDWRNCVRCCGVIKQLFLLTAVW
jgi:hypothetical protein